ncbi:ISAs1 family transposase [Nostoc sp. C057]|uniref:ISAs1 family transposase n=1 Tax=Nostoc sp. C057 TaxID=2576903 RepID=UPI0021182F22|nr:ISAs1 family transposase [Nostoc sp. C057]
MSTGFEKKKSKTETSFTSNVNSFDITSKFQEYFTQVKDPRVERTRWHSLSQRVEKGHHRIETRKVYTVQLSYLPALHEQDLWAGLTTIVMVVRSIQHWNKTTHEVQFYITSLASDANKIGSAIRQHWGIENSVHWTLDVTFGEDECRIRSLHSPQNNAKATSHCP